MSPPTTPPAGSTPARPGLGRRLLRLVRGLVKWAVLVVLTVIVVRALDSRSLELRPWHTASLESEFTADDLAADTTLADYLAAEARLFDELDREVYLRLDPDDPELLTSRYRAGGDNDPRTFEEDWNRTREFEAEGTPRGAALLLHGLTDSPYSLHAAARVLREAGYHVLALRLPGHGTAPAALADVHWEDWRAAVRVGARHVAERVPEGGRFLVLGYSTGGALAVEYTAAALLDDAGRVPDELVLYSPCIGITPLAVVSSWHRLLSWVPAFDGFRWADVQPEYDPFKYTSFPKNGGEQVRAASLATQAALARLEEAGRMADFPPVLAFQSLYDATVLTRAVAEELFGRLVTDGSELVLFDLNRVAALRPFFGVVDRALLDGLEEDAERPYRLTVVTNASEDTRDVVALSYPPRSTTPERAALDLAWPRGVYSLSHVAMPFASDDPLYGNEPDPSRPEGRVQLGVVSPRGERGLLQVSMNDLMRLRHNPFHGYVQERLREQVAADR